MRNTFIAAALAAGALLSAQAPSALAQGWTPQGNVELIVPASAGQRRAKPRVVLIIDPTDASLNFVVVLLVKVLHHIELHIPATL